AHPRRGSGTCRRCPHPGRFAGDRHLSRLDRARNEIGPGCRSHPIGHHIVVFRM
ncbi:MAG: hypothetical protein AVDCRST_MAG19-630, partial [uncultured Thermomicrobiales bacterium]